MKPSEIITSDHILAHCHCISSWGVPFPRQQPMVHIGTGSSLYRSSCLRGAVVELEVHTQIQSEVEKLYHKDINKMNALESRVRLHLLTNCSNIRNSWKKHVYIYIYITYSIFIIYHAQNEHPKDSKKHLLINRDRRRVSCVNAAIRKCTGREAKPGLPMPEFESFSLW